MAKTPVTMKIDGYKDREVMMVSYDFEQETDVEGQMSGIPSATSRRTAASSSSRQRQARL